MTRSRKCTARERVMTALRGGTPDKVPFAVYEQMITYSTAERELRERGLCIVRKVRSYRTITPNVKEKLVSWTEPDGREMRQGVYETPYGTLSFLQELAGFTAWMHERLFKSPDDYKALLFMIKDTRVVPNYGYAAVCMNSLGGDYVVRDTVWSEPITYLMENAYLGTERFCIEWMDNRDEILKLYDAVVDLNRRTYPIVADAPTEYVCYGGNVMPEVTGLENFQKYFVPHYNEAAEVMHKKGKILGSHLDGNNAPIMDALAETDLDFIEAYDPGVSPSISIAREKFPNKPLWINWPCTCHLYPPDGVKEKTKEIIAEAHPGNGLIIGITEDVPESRWVDIYTAILDGIDESPLLKAD